MDTQTTNAIRGVQFLVGTQEDQIRGVGIPRKPDEYDMIYLANNEWGNELMYQVAQAWFKEFPDCQFVQVYEHAGWHLGFRNDPELSCWTTANDMARLPKTKPKPRTFSGYYEHREWRNGDCEEEPE